MGHEDGSDKGNVADAFKESKDEAEDKFKKHKPLTRIDDVKSDMDEKKKQQEEMKKLIAQIPSAKEEIFAYVIDWDTVRDSQIVEKKLRPWVKKKVVDYLGAEEEAMIEFIIRKVEAKARPDEMFNELES